MVTVSTAAFYGRTNLQLGTLRGRAEALQSQIGTGERLARSSDDPAAAARLRALDRRERLSGVDAANANRVVTDLTLADQTVAAMADSVIRARELALQARNMTLSDSNFAQIKTEIDNLRTNILSLANTRNAAGHALFGGEATGDAYTQVAGVVGYVGNGVVTDTDLGDGQKVQRSLLGPDVLEFGGTDIFEVLGNLSAALATGGATAGTGASDALTQLDMGLEKLTATQTIIGTRQAWVETIAERRVAASELNAEEQAELGGADLASTISKLQELMTVLEASQASFVRLSGLSLFDRLN